jgi:hypothetical protein
MSFVRLSLAAALGLSLAACSGSGLGNVLGGLNPSPVAIQCDPGTQVQLASPQAFQTGVSPNIGQIIIVANGENNLLHDNFSQWNITLSDQFGNRVTGSNLSPYSFPSGPHPFGSDFYYASTIPQLSSGTTWNVQLEEQGANCNPDALSSFST